MFRSVVMTVERVLKTPRSSNGSATQPMEPMEGTSASRSTFGSTLLSSRSNRESRIGPTMEHLPPQTAPYHDEEQDAAAKLSSGCTRGDWALSAQLLRCMRCGPFENNLARIPIGAGRELACSRCLMQQVRPMPFHATSLTRCQALLVDPSLNGVESSQSNLANIASNSPIMAPSHLDTSHTGDSQQRVPSTRPDIAIQVKLRLWAKDTLGNTTLLTSPMSIGLPITPSVQQRSGSPRQRPDFTLEAVLSRANGERIPNLCSNCVERAYNQQRKRKSSVANRNLIEHSPIDFTSPHSFLQYSNGECLVKFRIGCISSCFNGEPFR